MKNVPECQTVCKVSNNRKLVYITPEVLDEVKYFLLILNDTEYKYIYWRVSWFIDGYFIYLRNTVIHVRTLRC